MNLTFTNVLLSGSRNRNSLSNWYYVPILIVFFIIGFNARLSAQCAGTGAIITSGPGALGDPAVLDPNGDDFITKLGTAFTSGTNELNEFETLLSGNGCACEVDWTRFGGAADEPDSDIQTGGTCGNTDIVTDDDGGADHAYYSIIDTDGDCNTTDDLKIVFRIRVADVVSGAFSFEVLVNNDLLLGTDDPDGVQCCNGAINPGFEREIQLSTGGGTAGVNMYDINGFINGSNVTPDASYTLATSAHVAYACGTDSDCGSGAVPVFYTFLLPLDDLGYNDCTDVLTDLSLAAVSSQSVNPVIAECNSVSDVGGVDDNADNSSCGSFTCPGGCNSCDLGEALICAANSFQAPLPVEWMDFSATLVDESSVKLNWLVGSEVNNMGFEIERSTDVQNWDIIGFKQSEGDSNTARYYSFSDSRPYPGYNYYRLKQMDHDGTYDYSEIKVVLTATEYNELLKAFPNPNAGVFTLSLNNPNKQRATVKLFDSTGSLIWEEKFNDSEAVSFWEKEFYLKQHEIYFAVTQVGAQTETLKIVVIDRK